MNEPIEGELGKRPEIREDRTDALPNATKPVSLLRLALWLGLMAGVLELTAYLIIRANTEDTRPYLGKIHAFPWTIPLVNAALLVLIAAPIALLCSVRSRGPRDYAFIVLVSCALLPSLLVIAPSLYAGSLLLVALGIASLIAPIAQRRPGAVERVVRGTLPVLIVGVVAMAIWRSAPRPRTFEVAASREAPNVLLIVLDTVRFDHLSLDGTNSSRETSPQLAEFARTGISFNGARATAPWTLPSHASLMTGRWAFEVCDERYSPMSSSPTTLAEALAARGFDTVGLVANTFFCTYSTGLARGFARYEDLPVTAATVLNSTVIGGRIIDAVGSLFGVFRPGEPEPLQRYERIDAASINGRFLHWIDHRRATDRPFFAFLNYFDAHDPYVVPSGAEHRFGSPPDSSDSLKFLKTWWASTVKDQAEPDELELLIDGYDSCIAYLDEQLGALFRELERRELLDETIVVVTSDHGEAFGEHDLFGHGISLYEDQLHVPLIFVAPGRIPGLGAIDDVVSLRDVPSTILDLVALGGPNLPGASLAPLWGSRDVTPSPAFASVPGPDSHPPNFGRSPTFRGPMMSIMDEHSLKYIMASSAAGTMEEIFNLSADPGERVNLAAPVSRPLLERFRSRIAAFERSPDSGGDAPDR